MKVAIYARVSTDDKGQDPETQLQPLREYCRAQEWETAGEYVDQARAQDQLRRVRWRQLLDDAARRRFDAIVVWKVDRAFRSVLEGVQTIQRLRHWGVGFRSFTEAYIDTTSPLGEAVFQISLVWAELERKNLGERTKAGMERVRRKGVKLGRPDVSSRPGFKKRSGEILERVESGALSKRKAALDLKVGQATIARLLQERKKEKVA